MTRADVLMFFPPQRDKNGNPTGRRLVNDMDSIAAGEPLTTVRLPERGTGNQTPQTAGATIMRNIAIQQSHFEGSWYATECTFKRPAKRRGKGCVAFFSPRSRSRRVKPQSHK